MIIGVYMIGPGVSADQIQMGGWVERRGAEGVALVGDFYYLDCVPY